MFIRTAILADIPIIARINVDTWRSNYVGIVPDDYLAGMSYEKYKGFELDFLSGKFFYYIAEIEREIAGYACITLDNEADKKSRGELKMIYVKKDFQNLGIGKKLFLKISEYLYDNGCKSLIAWTLKLGNSSLFYSSLGGFVCKERKEIIGGKELDEICYFYKIPLKSQQNSDE